jgi:ribosomal protein S15P/S13E
MKAIVWSAVFVAGLLAPAHLCAQDKKVFEVTKLADHLYELSTDGGGYPEKVVASVGSDGVLIVDSGERRTGPALAEALKAFGKGMPKIIINTHSHIEHPEVTAKLLAFLPDDVRLVPGHAEDCDMAEARKFLDMLRKTSEIVRAEMAKGKDLARLQADDVLASYASYESSYVKRPEWIEYWYSAYTTSRSDKPRPYAPVIRALQEKGAAAAMEAYGELRRTRPNDYWFEDQALMFMGRRLFRMKRFDDATVFLERCIKEFPGSEGAAVSHNVLASVCEQQGDLAKARLHLMTYLEKHPQDAAARKKLVEIEDKLKRSAHGG